MTVEKIIDNIENKIFNIRGHKVMLLGFQKTSCFN